MYRERDEDPEMSGEVEKEEDHFEEIMAEELDDEEMTAGEIDDEEIEYEGPPGTLLLIVGIVSLIVIAIAFIYMFIFTDWHISKKFWWSGFAAFVIALLFYVLYAYTSMGDIAKPMTAALFTMGVVLFYLAVWFMEVAPEEEGKKVIGIMVITVILIVILLLLLYTGVKGRREKRKRVKVMRVKKNEG